MRLLVAEADASLAKFLQTRFQQEHFIVHLVSTAQELSTLADDVKFDLGVLDLNLPGVPGIDSLRGIQRRWPDTPVILLSGDSAVDERVRALNAGADDFVVKPFAVAELVARAHAVLRRRSHPTQNIFQFEDLEVNRVTHEVNRGGRSLELSPKEYALLDFLLRNPGRPVSRGSIIEQVWRMQGDAITNVVDVYINYLRRKIDAGADRPLIHTIRGVGYQIGGNHHPR